MHRLGKAVLLCLAGPLILTTPARAAHAYALTCCGVPSSVSVVDRVAHKTVSTLTTGQGSAFVALSPDNKTSYIANEAGSISVLDTATGVQTAEISLSSYGASPFGAFVSSDGTLYVVAGQGGSIDVLGIDTSNNSVQFDVQTPGSYLTNFSPIPLPSPAMSSDERHIYIFAEELIVFDVKTLASRTISVPRGDSQPEGVAVTSDESYALLTFDGGDPFGENAGQFVVLNLKTKSVETQIQFAHQDTVGSVVISPDGSLAYFPLNNSGNVSVKVFSLSSQTIINSFPVGAGSGTAIAISPDGSEIELGEYDANIVSVNAVTGAVIAQTGTLGYLVSITLSKDGSLMFVPNYDSAMVQVIDPQTSEITAQIPAGWETGVFDENYSMAVSADGRKIAVTGNLNVTFIDTAKQRVIGAVPFSAPYDCVTFSPHGDRAYLAVGGPTSGIAQVQVIDVETLTTTSSVNLTTSDQPLRDTVSPDGSTLYVSDQFGPAYCVTGANCEPELLAINIDNLAITQRITLGSNDITPGEIAISQDGTTAYVEGLPYSGGLSIVDLAEGQVTSTIPAAYGSSPIQMTLNQKFIYELAESNYTFYLIDLATEQATGVSGTAGFNGASDIAVSPDGRLVYITSALSPAVFAFSSNLKGDVITLGAIGLPSASDAVVFSPI